MRVMCVNDNWHPHPDVKNNPTPKVPEISEVVKEFNYTDGVYYILQGFHPHQGFKSTHFATLPEQTADEMNEVEKEAIIM